MKKIDINDLLKEAILDGMSSANITEIELQKLEACQSETDWGIVCDQIKKARNGMYPPDWWDKVKMSGMMDRILSRWGADSSLKLTDLDGNEIATDK